MNNLGIRVYSLGMMLLGAAGLVWADFALVWQPVPADVPSRTMLAYIVAAILLIAGAGLNLRGTVTISALVLTILCGLGVLLLHVPHVIAHPLAVSPYAGVAEQLALVSGAFIVFALGSGKNDSVARIGRIAFGLCAIVFGITHFRFPVDTAAMVPKWLPPQQLFWAYATGVAHIAAGLAILSGIQARPAAYLLTLMFAIFQVLVHFPLLAADPHSHLNWVMNGMNLALTGAAWIVADSLSLREKRLSA